MQAKHKFTIKKHLENSEFDITLFKFQSNKRFRILLDGTEHRFEIEQTSENFNMFHMYQTYYKPGFPLHGPLGANNKINRVLNQIDHWLKTVVNPYIEEIKLSQKWKEIETENLFNRSDNWQIDDLSRLNIEEVRFLEDAINEIKIEIKKEFNPSIELIKTIDEKLDYIVKSVDRLNRFDLRGVVFNTFISIGVNLAVDTESGKVLFEIFCNAFNSIPTLYETAKLLLQSRFGR